MLINSFWQKKILLKKSSCEISRILETPTLWTDADKSLFSESPFDYLG